MSKSLWDLIGDESSVIMGYGDGLDSGYKERLKDLGFHVNQSITCLQSPKLGAPKVFRLNNSIYALDDQVAKEVYCE